MRTRALLLLAVFASWSLAAAPAHAASEGERLDQALQVLAEISEIPEDAIPPSMLRNAHGVAVIPSVIKVGFGVGGQRGRGVLVVRNEEGGWSAPVFMTLTGGSFGWQIGAQSTDVVLVFKNPKSVVDIADGTFTLGGTASVAAGPVGRDTKAATDLQLKAEIYSYARARGLFVGLALQGSALRIDTKANARFYGEAKPAQEILAMPAAWAPNPAPQLATAIGILSPPRARTADSASEQ